jgi:hypothetical protein
MGRLTLTSVIWFAGDEGLFARSASSTTICIGPVTAPTRTRTLVMIPRPVGGKPFSPVERFCEPNEQLGNWVKKNQAGSLQAAVLFGTREPRFAPNVTAEARDAATPERASAAAQAQTQSPTFLPLPRTRTASPPGDGLSIAKSADSAA